MNILIKNGRIWDGQTFFEADILMENGTVTDIGKDLTAQKTFIYDASGKLVVPGLVDCHMHMHGITEPIYGISPEAICFPFGVTAAADAGATLGDKQLLESFAVKAVVFAEAVIRDGSLDREATLSRLANYGSRAVGIKVFYDETTQSGIHIGVLADICELARERSLQVMVHCNHSPTSMLSIVETMASGDILSHVYHGGKHNCTEDDFAALKLARRKGIILDAAFAGNYHTDFGILRQAVSAGFFPDTISTDVVKGMAYTMGGRYGLTTCMSMARTAGVPEEVILRAVTTAPAKALEQNWGRLQIGGAADLAVLEYTQEPFRLQDRSGAVLENNMGYRCKLTVSDGVVVFRD